MKKLVVLCPADLVTGGAEALHQLASTARGLGVDASILYYPWHRAEVNPAYAHYDVSVTGPLPDQLGTVVVVPETAMQYVPTGPTQAQWALWWLSVDNFFRDLNLGPVTAPADDPIQLRWLCSPNSGIEHLTQSQYAREYLYARGTKSLMLTDFISDAFVRGAEERCRQPKKDLVLYNPRKGMEFTQRLINASRGELEFAPIDGLGPDGVADLLGSAKLYVDFGEHPGRDRIPREAALSGCCVITGRRGAAGNPVDMPIPDRFRLDEQSATCVAEFLELATATMRDFDQMSMEFEDYRRIVAGQRETFVAETAAFLARVRRTRLDGFQAGAGKRRNKKRR